MKSGRGAASPTAEWKESCQGALALQKQFIVGLNKNQAVWGYVIDEGFDLTNLPKEINKFEF